MDFAVTGGEDEPRDVNGYLGKTVHERGKMQLKEITPTDFIKTIYTRNKLKEIMFQISQIDNSTGAVTKNELEDIIKLNYPDTLKDKNLMPIISMFSSPQNKILIHHSKFRDWILKGMAKLQMQDEKKKIAKQAYFESKKPSALDLLAQQSGTIKDQIETLERSINNTKKDHRQRLTNSTLIQCKRFDKDARSQLSELNLSKLRGNDGGGNEYEADGNSYVAYSTVKSRPYSSVDRNHRTLSNKRGSAAPPGYAASKLMADLDQIEQNGRTLQLNQDGLTKQQHKYLKRPRSSITNSGYNSKANADRKYLANAAQNGAGNEAAYVNIKELIEQDNLKILAHSQYGKSATIAQPSQRSGRAPNRNHDRNQNAFKIQTQ